MAEGELQDAARKSSRHGWQAVASPELPSLALDSGIPCRNDMT
jgi:hypothetical protein